MNDDSIPPEPATGPVEPLDPTCPPLPRAITSGIDDEKKEAISTTEGPLLIIAGPGSGKTKTLVERVVNLVSKGIEPPSIMVSTFTEKAAARSSRRELLEKTKSTRK